jgi:hypothetical protein
MIRKVKLLGIGVVLGNLFLAAIVMAEPTVYEGKIVAIRLNTGDSPSRLSILVENNPQSQAGCENGWYAFENADQEVGLLWTSGLMIALHEQKRVFIVGNDRCDRFNIEGIDLIDLQR